MWIGTWDWINCKFMGSTMITLWRITRRICRLWYMTLPRSIWLVRLALTTALAVCFHGCGSFAYSSCCFFQLRYPEVCLSFKYDPTFPIRGLYYDKVKGCLMKLDFFGSIELDECFYGRRKVFGAPCFVSLAVECTSL